MWGTVRFFLDIAMFNNYKVEIVFLMLQSYGDSAQAFWNFVLFCVCDQTVRSYISARYLPCVMKSSLRNSQESMERLDIQHRDDEERPLIRKSDL